MKERLKRTFRNDSVEDIFLYIHGYGYLGLRSGKSSLLEKEGAGTLVFQPHYTIHSCGALCTYSLYDKQVNGAGAWANGTVHQAIFSLHSLNRNRATLQIGLITSHLTVIALSIPYWSFVTSGLPSLEPFPSARSPNEEGVSGLWSKMLIPLFVLLLLLGREEDKKRPSVLLVSQPVASKDCPLSVGCWSSLLRGSRIQQPNLYKGHPSKPLY